MPDLDPIKQIKSLNILAGPCAASPVDMHVQLHFAKSKKLHQP